MSTKRFTEHVTSLLREAIKDAGGNEILAVGQLDDDGLVTDVTIAARGTADAVPALMPYMQRSDVVIHNHPSGQIEPSSADLRVASEIGNQGIGFLIIDNYVERVYAVAEPVGPVQTELIDEEEIVSHLLPGGSLSNAVDYYEPRDSQVQMLEAVSRGFNDNSIVVVEAGTGVGKSLAYLLPAFRWAGMNDERIVISTATINLQQQLLEKDIPLVQEILCTEMKAVLVKGRSNYLCLRRLGEALEEQVLFNEDDDELESIREWAASTATGGKEDLSFLPSSGVWGSVCSEADTCLGLRCSKRNDCFVLKSRRAAAAAQILIVNHHLLFSDLSIRAGGAGYDITAVLPPFQKVIFDEAHNIEKSATSFFSLQLSRFSVNRNLSVLARKRRQRQSGLLVALRGISSKTEILDTISGQVSDARDVMDDLDTFAVSLDIQGSYRLTPGPMDESFMELFSRIDALQTHLVEITKGLHLIVDEYRDKEEPELIITAKAMLRRLEVLVLFCQNYREYEEHPERVFWFTKTKTHGGEMHAVFHSTPVEVSEIMRETVFTHYDTVICTSATLAVKSDFSYWFGRIGLEYFDDKSVETWALPSPFPYRDNVLLAVPSDAPLPSDASYQEYVIDFVGEILEISEGGALVLFTSYQMLADTYDGLASGLAKLGITALRQGTD
ncbi:MAG: hypothetical protein HN368_20015, partial [Spirochaetales bacterium]|nr:hypothetical protein [Spirochaetales bacterium]